MDRTIELLKESDALLEGHFLLSSGKHSNRYIQCAKLIQNPKFCKEVADIIAKKVKEKGLKVDLCIGPAMGGIIIAYEVARSLGVDAIFSERVDGNMQLRRGFEVKDGMNVLLVEDVITTGKSSFETVKLIEENNAKVVCLSSIVNRSSKDSINGLEIISATKLDIDTWEEDQLPDYLKDISAVKPGSRKIK